MSTSFFASRAVFTAFMSVALLGAGCRQQAPNAPIPVTDRPAATSSPSTPPAATSTAPTVANPPTASNTTSGVVELTPKTKPDDTWRTHTNAALQFTFAAPTKGRYAPLWEVKFLKQGDARIQDGCYVDGQSQREPASRVSVNGVEFCHTASSEGAAGTMYQMDYYATLKGSQYIVLVFTKPAYSAGALNCKDFSDGLSTSPTSCIKFDFNEYKNLLNDIIATFR